MWMFFAHRYSLLSISASGVVSLEKREISRKGRLYADIEHFPLSPHNQDNATWTPAAVRGYISSNTNKLLPLDDRDKDMKRGVELAVAMALSSQTSFPAMTAVLSTKDKADMQMASNTKSHCVLRERTGGEEEEVGRVVARFRWPPVFCMNRVNRNASIFVVVPDFTYFSDFAGGHDHGFVHQDVWFDATGRAAKEKGMEKASVFSSKRDEAVWRGTVSGRDWGALRQAVRSCHSLGMVDSKPQAEERGFSKHMSRKEMCSYKALISVPGNGVWTWGLKFALLCPSVPLMMSPEVVGGETWETRRELGLREGTHFLPLSSNASSICREIRRHVDWIRKNPTKAHEMALAGRALVLEKLDRQSVLRDFAKLLLDYAHVYKS